MVISFDPRLVNVNCNWVDEVMLPSTISFVKVVVEVTLNGEIPLIIS